MAKLEVKKRNKSKGKSRSKTRRKSLLRYLREGGAGFLGAYSLSTGVQMLILGLMRRRLWDAFVESFEMCRQIVKTGRDVDLYRCTVINFKSSPDVEKLKMFLEVAGFATGMGWALLTSIKNNKLEPSVAIGATAGTGTATILNPRLLVDAMLEKIAYRWFKALYKRVKAAGRVHE